MVSEYLDLGVTVQDTFNAEKIENVQNKSGYCSSFSNCGLTKNVLSYFHLESNQYFCYNIFTDIYTSSTVWNVSMFVIRQVRIFVSFLKLWCGC